MTKNLIIFVFLFITASNLAQDNVEIAKKFFTTEHFRLGAALGYDFSWAGDNGKTALMSQKGSIDNNKFNYYGTPNQTLFLGLDAYSPTSTLGFLGGVGLNFQNYTVHDKSGLVRDSIGTTNLEIPIYARLRIGKVLGGGQFWLALGGGYNLNTKAEIIQKDNFGGIISISEDNKQFKSHPFLSGMVGYEILMGPRESELYDRDIFRILLYAKANYDLGNRLDNENIPLSSAIGSYSDPSIEFIRISVGVKVLLRLSKASELIGNSFLESINQQ